MWHFFLIVICSYFLTVPLSAQNAYGWQYGTTNQGTHLTLRRTSGPLSVSLNLSLRNSSGTVVATYNGVQSVTSTATVFTMNGRPFGSYHVIENSSNGLPRVDFLWNGGPGIAATIQNIQFQEQSQFYSWTFGPEWAGVQIEIRSSSGALLSVGVVPSGGGVISGTVTAPSLSGAQVLADGVLIGPLEQSVELQPSGFSVGRAGFGYGFDASYGGVDWQIRREDSTVATQGTVPPNGYAIDGNVTLRKTEQGEVFTYVDIGDGPGQWISTGIMVNPNTQNFFSFVNNTYQTQPAPMPTPGELSPAPTPTDQPTSPTPSTTVTQPSDPEDLVMVDVQQLDLGDIDDNEINVISTVGAMQQLVRDIVANIAQAQENLSNSVESLNSLRLGGVGRQCTFQMGPASVNIQTSGPLRTGLTLLVIGLAAFAAASMIRSAVQ